MLRHTPQRSGWLSLLSLLVGLLALQPPGAAHGEPAPASGLAAAPQSLSVSVELGTSKQVEVAISNGTTAPLRPTVYEAFAQPPGGAALQGEGPTGPRRVALPQQAERVDGALLEELAGDPARTTEFIVYLKDQADLGAAYGIADWAERGRYVHRTLTEWAERSQAPLRAQLRAGGFAFEPFWIVNAILVRGTEADARALASRSDVALVRANHVTSVPPGTMAATAATTDQCSPDAPGNPICWSVRRVGADRAWRDFGVTGQGVVVANIDTGVGFLHPGLVQRYRGYRSPDVYEHDYNWFDPQRIHGAPRDDGGHGTHVMGITVGVGDGTAAQPAVGVAPGARWIAAQGCESFMCREDDLISSAQWVLAPTRADGSEPRPDLRPMVVNNSWGGGGGNDWFAGYTAAWRAAGIFPVFAAGNASYGIAQQCRSIGSPGDYADVVAVGATDSADKIAGFSLIGPSRGGRLKPDFTAPGTYESYRQGVLSTYPDGGYRALQGTSMAAPMVTGLVALIWSANPGLIGDYERTYALLAESARLLTDTRCGDAPGAVNNVYGNGRVDAYAAVAAARVDVPWLETPSLPPVIAANGQGPLSFTLNARKVPSPGTYRARLQIYGADLSQPPATVEVAMQVTPASGQASVVGRVLSAENGAPVQALVGVEGGLLVPTDLSGNFKLVLARGSYRLVATAPSFLDGQRSVNVADDLQRADLQLTPDQPRAQLAVSPAPATLALGQQRQVSLSLRNSGTRTLYYSVQVPQSRFAMWRSDEQGGPTYSWVTLPPDAPALTLADNQYLDGVPMGIRFPFYGYVVTDTLVTSDGMIGFARPLSYDAPVISCLPDPYLLFYAIAPFRADLDPSRGGAIRFGTVAGGRTFVLSYEDVPLHSDPAGATYSFQVLLHDDGRVTFQYRDLGPLPTQLGVGIQRTPLEIENVGCGHSTPIAPGLAIEFRPQTPALLWIDGARVEGEIAPGGTAQLAVPLRWVRPDMAQPYRATIKVVGNDPMRPASYVRVETSMLPAPREQRLTVIRN